MTAYEVRVRGVVPTLLAGQLADQHIGYETVLTGDVATPDDLYDLIDRLYTLGLDLLEVRELPA